MEKENNSKMMHTSGEDKYNNIGALTNEAPAFRKGIKARLRAVSKEMAKNRDS